MRIDDNVPKLPLTIHLGHYALEEAGILHRDISINNLMLWLDEGLLIDLDYALDLFMRDEDIIGPRGVRTVSFKMIFIVAKAHKQSAQHRALLHS